jgi:hypothetical protein
MMFKTTGIESDRPCDEDNESCRTLTCKSCPQLDKITASLSDYIDSHYVETVSFKEGADDSVRHTL